MKSGKRKRIKFSWRKLAENKGVYIALASVVFVVGVYVYAANMRKAHESKFVSFDDKAWQEAISESGVDAVDVVDVDRVQKEAEKKPLEKTENPSRESGEEKNTTDIRQQPDAVETMAQQKREFSMILPCEGQVAAKCSLEDLVFCSAMEDWRTHNGVDIAAEEGEPVLAVEDGVVAKVFEDEFLGIVVEIKHENGLLSRYANLQSLDFISAGTSVSRGDIIGGVGKPGSLEKDMGTHLHFEIQLGEEYKNPDEYLKFG